MVSTSSTNEGFVFENRLQEIIQNERLYDQHETDPVECPTQDEHLAEFDWFFSDSPFSSPTSSPSNSRSASPAPVTPLASNNEGHGPKPVSCNSQKRRNKEKSKANRKRNRAEKRDEERDDPYVPRPGPSKKFRKNPEAIKTQYDASNIPTNQPGYTSPPHAGGRIFPHEALKKKGFEVIPWDGKSSGAITDACNRIIGARIGEPANCDWNVVHKGAAAAIETYREMCRFSPGEVQHRRGRFPALSFGISHGGGQKQPGNVYNDPQNAEVLSALAADPFITRIAGHANAGFATWAPNLYTYYEEHLDPLLNNDPTLRRTWPKNVWGSFAINFGPKTVCRPHRDNANLPFGLCAITALGDYDHKRGGHLVLWDLKLILEFPPGATIIIPSAAILHSNTPIDRGEKRFSFAQYSAGGLFRWVDQGFQPTPQFKDSLSEDELEEDLKKQKKRCKLGLSLFSTLTSLGADQGSRKKRI